MSDSMLTTLGFQIVMVLLCIYAWYWQTRFYGLQKELRTQTIEQLKGRGEDMGSLKILFERTNDLWDRVSAIEKANHPAENLARFELREKEAP